MHPILFKIPLPHWKVPWLGELHAFPIYAYGVMLGFSLVVGWYISLTLAKKDGLPRETMANNYVFTAFCALFGSRLLYIVTNLDEFKTWQDWFAIRSGGLVAYGGFIGGFLGSWFYCARRRIRLLGWADAAVPALASGLFFTRIGCYLFGCDFGKKFSESFVACGTADNAQQVCPSGFKRLAAKMLVKLGTFPEWHYDYKQAKFLDAAGYAQAYQPYREAAAKGADAAALANLKPQVLDGSPAFVQHMDSDPVVRDLHHSLPVHPTQLYEILAGALLFGGLMLARRNIKKREAAGLPFFRGELFIVFTFGYGVLRFLIEIVRDDAERGVYGPMLQPHVAYPLCLFAFALAFVFGLSNMIPETKYQRTVWRCVALLLPLGVFMLLKPDNAFARPEYVQLSTSQWIAVFTGVAAAAYYRRGLDVAIADPVGAADLGEGVPALVEAEAALARGDKPTEEGDEEEEEEIEEEEAAKPEREKERRRQKPTLRDVPAARRKDDDEKEVESKESDAASDEAGESAEKEAAADEKPAEKAAEKPEPAVEEKAPAAAEEKPKAVKPVDDEEKASPTDEGATT